MTRTEHSKITDTRRITRRQFLGRTAALSGIVAAPWFIPSSARGADGNVAPSDRITVGLVGKGLMGGGHLSRLVGDRDVQVLAVCDVD
ncbi:MAG: twin-arginine translocation signal domain-containing protein, partial [Sedimentisphaerales bacterium]|nr:twin-arginine translocation signal domain-containing protein [Sedimentisphaerales bacterium]